jgi:hypothetical protein
MKRIGSAAAAAVVTAGLLVASSTTADAVTSVNTCKYRGYNTILQSKALKNGSKTVATAYMTYNKNKGQEYCIVMRNRAGFYADMTVRTLKNDNVTVDESRTRRGPGASGSVSFNAESSARQQAFLDTGDYIVWVSFHY